MAAVELRPGPGRPRLARPADRGAAVPVAEPVLHPGGMRTVLVDAENVRRSVWPNIAPGALAELAAAWGRRRGARVVAVYDGPAPAGAEGAEGTEGSGADDRIVELAAAADGPVWVVTSDRELRARVAGRAERVLGGGTFARELLRL